MRRALIVDLDNTLYDWNRFFTKSFRSMVHVLSWATDIPEEKLISDFRDVYMAHGTAEYSFAIQELASIGNLNLPKEKLEEVIHVGSFAFSRTRKKNLILYPGVRETLKWLKETQGVLLIGLSDCPRYIAEGRLNILKLSYLFDGLFAWEGYAPPENFVSKDKSGKILINEAIPPDERKPNPTRLLSIIELFSLKPDLTFMIGDSLDRDIRLANKANVHSIWARYGTEVDEKSFDTLIKIAPWSKNSYQRDCEAQMTVHPEFIVDSFSQLRDIINFWQLRLF